MLITAAQYVLKTATAIVCEAYILSIDTLTSPVSRFAYRDNHLAEFIDLNTEEGVTVRNTNIPFLLIASNSAGGVEFFTYEEAHMCIKRYASRSDVLKATMKTTYGKFAWIRK